MLTFRIYNNIYQSQSYFNSLFLEKISVFYYIKNIVCTCQSQEDNRSIVDESLVYCHGGCEFEPPRRIIYLYNCLNIIHNQLQIISVAE